MAKNKRGRRKKKKEKENSIELQKFNVEVEAYWFSPGAQSCLALCDQMDCSTPDFPVLHYLPEVAQTHVHGVDDALQPSHPLLPPSPPSLSLSQHQGLFQ